MRKGVKKKESEKWWERQSDGRKGEFDGAGSRHSTIPTAREIEEKE